VKISWLYTNAADFSDTQNLNGGNIYDSMASGILKKHYDFSGFHVKRPVEKNTFKNIFKTLKFYKDVRKLHLTGDIIILDSVSLAFTGNTNENSKVAVIHQIHYDLMEKLKQKYFANKFYKRIKTIGTVVVVSEYWKEKISKLGAKNVKVIYNPFDINDFNFSSTELNEFRLKYSIPIDKRIIYIGNCRVEKGALDAFNALKDSGYYLFTSGFKTADIPVPNFNLSKREYLMLLKISDLVLTMSKTTEGWCRTAHEAMLCSTPVIGSGTGGMKELLHGGGQIIENNFDKLTSLINDLLNNRQGLEEIGRKGNIFARKFDMGYFENSWLGLIQDITSLNSKTKIK
jgi:glycosyltransferase involved in cell wall biosynthesis